MSKQIHNFWRGIVALSCLLCVYGMLVACPFCSSVSQTFSEEMESMDVVLFAELIEIPEEDENSTELPRCTFKVTNILNGEDSFAVGDPIEVHYFGPSKKGGTFLIMGTDPPDTMWGTPLVIEERAQEYLLELATLPKGPERLEYFIQFLEDEDELLARDAYDEFAKTDYEGVKALKDTMDHETLIRWIKNPDTPPSRRRLYFTMLGICGTTDDCDLLEELMQSEDREDKAGLNALVACYLSLAGADGLPLVEELFLANEEAEYADTYAAIMALRFHGNDNDVIPRQQLLPGMRAVLSRPDLADLVIPDLARWEDWEVMPQLVELFETADADSNWVRVPVVNYLRACPLPEAEETIARLEEIDPEAVKRAQTFFPFTQFAGPKRSDDPTVEPDDPSAESDPALAARQAVAPRRRVPVESQIVEPPPSRWVYPAVFGSLLVVALLLKITGKG